MFIPLPVAYRPAIPPPPGHDYKPVKVHAVKCQAGEFTVKVYEHGGSITENRSCRKDEGGLWGRAGVR